MPPRLMHVDLDAFFVEVCRQRMPELKGIDRIIVGGRADGRGVVTSASYGARKFGVKSGMPTGRALRLCPAATVVSGDFDWYREASRQVRAVLDYAGEGSSAGLLLLVTVLNGIAEELFFRGGLYAAIRQRQVPITAVAYAIATAATGNVMLAFAAAFAAGRAGIDQSRHRQSAHAWRNRSSR